MRFYCFSVIHYICAFWNMTDISVHIDVLKKYSLWSVKEPTSGDLLVFAGNPLKVFNEDLNKSLRCSSGSNEQRKERKLVRKWKGMRKFFIKTIFFFFHFISFIFFFLLSNLYREFGRNDEIKTKTEEKNFCTCV